MGMLTDSVVLVDIAIKWDVWKRQELYDFLISKDASRISLADNGEYIVFELDKHIYCDSTSQEQQKFLLNFFNELVDKKFVKKEDVVDCLKNEQCWINELIIQSPVEHFDHEQLLNEFNESRFIQNK